jgi:hypothetical protein
MKQQRSWQPELFDQVSNPLPITVQQDVIVLMAQLMRAVIQHIDKEADDEQD